MKNYKFVFGLLLSSAFSYGAQAASITPTADTGRAALPATGGGPANLHSGNPTQLPLTNANKQLQASAMPATRAHNAAKEIPINNFMSYMNLSKAFYYLESSGGVKSLRTDAKLATQKTAANDVSEPASEILLLAGLSALAIAIRRQSPS